MSKPKPKIKLVKKPGIKKQKQSVASYPSREPDVRARMAAKKAAKRAAAKTNQKPKIPKDL